MAIVKDLESLKDLIQRVRKAQEEFATFDQERVDKIFRKVAQKMNDERITLANYTGKFGSGRNWNGNCGR